MEKRKSMPKSYVKAKNAARQAPVAVHAAQRTKLKGRRSEESQSAMEYMITYSWAILIIAVAVALLYLYLVAPRVIVSSQCSFKIGAYCEDMVLGSNTTTHATEMALFLTNTQTYPMLNPHLYVSINGKNTTSYACKPYYVLPGGSIICTVPVPNVTSSLGEFFAGNIYLNATYCGLVSNPFNVTSCKSAPTQTYSGNFNAHAAPLISTTTSVSLSANQSQFPADGSYDSVFATVKMLGYPLKGATVNFTVNTSNAKVFPLSASSDSRGIATSGVESTHVGNVTVKAYFAGTPSNNVTIDFVPYVSFHFFIPTILSHVSSSAIIAKINGVSYTYSTMPSYLNVSVDGNVVYNFTRSLQINSTARLVFKNVTINGVPSTSSNNTVVASTNSTVVPHYTLQYYITMAVSPSGAGTVSPSSGWFNQSQYIPISEAPSGLNVFDNWTGLGAGSYTGSSSSAAITADSAITETANYYSPINITFTISPSMSGTSGTVLTVDGTSYAYSSLPVTITVSHGSTVTYSYASPISGGTGTQYVFSSLTGCGASGQGGSFSATSTCTVSATYTTQYHLTTLASPSSGGTVSPSSGWYNSGSVVTISETNATNYKFEGWSGTGNANYTGTATSATVTMNGPVSETADYHTPLTITFATSSMSGTGSNIVLKVNGKSYNASSIPLTIGIPYGGSVTYNYTGTVSGSAGTRYIYGSASGCGTTSQSGSVTVTSNCTVTASYTTQYYLTTSASPSGAGTVSPSSGWYNSGSSVTISETPNSGYVFHTWTGSGAGSNSSSSSSITVTMNNPIAETADYYSPVVISFGISSMSGATGTVLTVNGTSYSYSQLPVSKSVPYGTSVTYSYTSPISGGTGTQYVFSTLSGCGATSQSGSVTVTSNCTISASYTTQYYLTTSVSPSGAGTVSPSSGWYNSGSSVTISETPSSYYIFNSWSGTGNANYTGTATSATVTMNGPVSETANFYSPVYITFEGPSVSGTEVTVNGTSYAGSSLPKTIEFAHGASVSYSYSSPLADGTGTQLVNPAISATSGCSTTSPFTATSNCTISASYTTQYHLTMAVSPSGGGTVSPGSEWVNAGSSVSISESPNTNYVFDDWTCSGTGCYSGTSTSATITMDNPITETANYYNYSTITFDISSMSGTSGTVLTVDGTSYAYSSLPVTINVPYGTSVTYSYASPISGGTGTQYVFSSLTGCGQTASSGTFTPSQTTCTISASYTEQYYLTMAVSPSGDGTVSPGSEWINAGSSVTITATASSGYNFVDWTCSGTGCYSGTSSSETFTPSGPVSETANFAAIVSSTGSASAATSGGAGACTSSTTAPTGLGVSYYSTSVALSGVTSGSNYYELTPPNGNNNLHTLYYYNITPVALSGGIGSTFTYYIADINSGGAAYFNNPVWLAIGSSPTADAGIVIDYDPCVQTYNSDSPSFGFVNGTKILYPGTNPSSLVTASVNTVYKVVITLTSSNQVAVSVYSSSGSLVTSGSINVNTISGQLYLYAGGMYTQGDGGGSDTSSGSPEGCVATTSSACPLSSGSATNEASLASSTSNGASNGASSSSNGASNGASSSTNSASQSAGSCLEGAPNGYCGFSSCPSGYTCGSPTNGGVEEDSSGECIRTSGIGYSLGTCDKVTSSSNGASSSSNGSSNGASSGGHGGGCILGNDTITLYNGLYINASSLKVGEYIKSFNTINGTENIQRVTAITESNTSVIEFINGKFGLTPTDQPIYVRNATYTGWVKNPDSVKVGWYIYSPTDNSWVKVTSVTYKYGNYKVYDIFSGGENDFIADGYLADMKIA
ncbi:MAG: hypothetical protein QXX90_02305 [Candidatus Micrarchaeaceae archaeon]